MRVKPAFDVDILHRAEAVIAHGALTNSKRPESFVRGVYPTHLTQGLDSYVWDTNNNRYIDFICGLGSNLFGYANTEISNAIATQLRKGTALSLGTVLEVETAETFQKVFPFIERLRFLKTGSEATTAACIIARAATGRSLILSEGYHGWHSEFQSLTPPHYGVGDSGDIEPFRFIEQIDSDTAAVIIEPIITDNSPQRIDWLRRLRERCTETGTVLVFDEIITGLRYPSYSVSMHYAIIPDLICLGKAVGGGMPLSVVGGKRELMVGDYFVSSTFAGETLSLAAAKRALELCLSGKFRLVDLTAKANLFQETFNAICGGIVRLEGYGTRSRLVGEKMLLALFLQETTGAGLLMGPSLFFNFAHVDLVDCVYSSLKDIVTRIKTGSVSLLGELPKTPYAETVRSKS